MAKILQRLKLKALQVCHLDMQKNRTSLGCLVLNTLFLNNPLCVEFTKTFKVYIVTVRNRVEKARQSKKQKGKLDSHVLRVSVTTRIKNPPSYTSQKEKFHSLATPKKVSAGPETMRRVRSWR